MATEKRPDPGRRRDRRTAKQKPRPNAPEIVYTQPKTFDSRRLLLRVLTVAAVVLAFSIGLSIFFRVGEITVTGCDKYTAWTVCEASGIEKGDSLLFFGEATVSSRIMDALPYVKYVRFGIKLPGSVNIIIEEAPVAYALQAENGDWWMITAEGKIVEKTDAQSARKTTTITGVILQDPQVGQMARAYEQPEQTAATGADRLNAALRLVQLLEANEILGQMSNVDVSNLQQLQLWYKNQFQIRVGDIKELDTKIATVKAAVPRIGTYQTGVMDLVKDGEIWKVVFTNQSQE